MSPRVVALGQRFAGDDAVGLAVAAELRARGVPVREIADATGIVEALADGSDVILIDALLGAGEPGRVRVLSPEDLGRERLAAVSSHGLDVPAAAALARALYPGAGRLSVVAVQIARAEPFAATLSPAVAAAVGAAAEAVTALLRGVESSS